MKIVEPKSCSHLVDGKPCGATAMYKIGAKGFCEQHKPKVNSSRSVSAFLRHESEATRPKFENFRLSGLNIE